MLLDSSDDWKVYEILFKHGPLTGAQVSKQYKELYDCSKHSETVRNRITELIQMNVVIEIGTIVCPISGKKVLLFDTNCNLPSKLPKRKCKGRKKGDLIEYIESEQTYIKNTSFNVTRKMIYDVFSKIIDKVREI